MSKPPKPSLPKNQGAAALASPTSKPQGVTAPPNSRLAELKTYIQHRKVAIVIAICMFLALVAAAVYMIHDVLETRRLDATSVVLSENLTTSFESKVKVSDFIWRLDGEIIEDVAIDTSQLGTVEVKFQYYNIKHRKRTKKFTIEVVDTTAPMIYGRNDYTITLGYAGDLTNLILSGDNLDDHPRREISGAYDLNEVGDYALEYVITDAYNNTARHPFTLHVVPPVTESATAPEMPASADDGTPVADIISQYKNGNTEIGIDVSSWQGNIDWAKVRAAGVEFAMLRVGYQVEYGGEYILDPTFRANLAGAAKVGLPLGVYFYSCADSIDEARRQAEWVLAQVGDTPLALGVAFDWEEWQDFNRAGMSFYTLGKVADTFLETVEAKGYSGMLYGSKNYLDKFWQRNSRPVWLAQYYDYPTYTKSFTLWQLTDAGSVPGIDKLVDLDVRYNR